MIIATKLPHGIDGYEAVQGQMYYSREQMIDFAQNYAVDYIKKIDASRMRANCSGQPIGNDADALGGELLA